MERIPGDAYLQDVGPNGRLRLAGSSGRGGVVARLSGDTQERDASWLDFSYAVDLSSDGRQLLLTDIGGGLSGLTGIALRAQGNPDPIVLGKGNALALAPDGRTLLAVSRDVSLDGRLTVLPVSAGSRRELEHPALQHVYEAAWFPDGARLALVAGPAATRARLFTWATTAGAEPRPLSAEGTFGRPLVSADGTRRGE